MIRSHVLVCCLILLCVASTAAAATPGSRAPTDCDDKDKEGTSTAATDHNIPGTTKWTAYPKAGPPSQQSGVDVCKTSKLLYEYHCDGYDKNAQLPTDTHKRRALIDCSKDGAVCMAGRCVIPSQDGGDNSCIEPCPSGTVCKQGKCIPPEENVSCEGSCGIFGCPACPIETEGCLHVNGDDPLGSAFTGGTIQFAQGPIKGIQETDACIENSTSLLEYDCENGAKTVTTIQCAEGCDVVTGSCLKTGCIDPDAGAGSVDVLWESFDLEYASATTTTQHDQYGQVIAQKADVCADEWHVKEAYCNGTTPDFKTGECPAEVFGYDVFDGCCGGACYVAENQCIDTDSATDNGLAPKTAGALFVGKGCGMPPEAARDTCGVAKIGNPLVGGNQMKSYMSTGDYGDSVKEFYCDGLEVKSVWVFCGGDAGGVKPLGAKSVTDIMSATSAMELPSAKYPQKAAGAPPPQPKKNLIAACQQGQCTTLPRCTRTEQKFWASSTTGLLVTGGHAELATRKDECLNDTTLREYRCADGMQGIFAVTSFAQPALYMVPSSKSCKGGCDVEQGKCKEDVIDLGKKWIPIWPKKSGGMP